ncbi:MAG: hypothetical protein OES47_07930 [Acidobacteriota bacterium]|nr:hypothetical protein [Acidobacteriota bacterium]
MRERGSWWREGGWSWGDLAHSLRCAALIGTLLAFIGCSSPERPVDHKPPVWFEDLIGTPVVGETESRAAAEWLRASLLGEAVEPPDPNDRVPRLIFLSLSNGRGPAEVVLAGGRGLAEAASNALRLAEARKAAREPLRLGISFVDRIGPALEAERRGFVDMARGFDGIAFERSSSLAFLPGEVLAWTLVNSDRELRASNIEKYLRVLDSPRQAVAEGIWQEGSAVLRTFRVKGFFADEEGVVRLERGHRRLHRTTKQEIWMAALATGDYLRRSVAASGRFVYSYLPKTDREKDEYNILRHAGAVYSMLELYESTEDDGLLAAAELALGFLSDQIEACHPRSEPEAEVAACVGEKGFVKLGGNALAILAMAKHAQVTGSRSNLDLMQRLARWMTGVQAPNGEFTIHKLHLASGEADDFVSQYYPGEALFALVRLNQLDGDPRWLNAAEAGARFLIEVRDAKLTDAELSHDHWLLYALDALYRSRSKKTFLDHAMRLARVIQEAQNLAPKFPDWKGSYYRPPRSTPTATRSEGLCAAYELSLSAGRQDLAPAILEAVHSGIDFQLQMQFRPESVLHLRAPGRALGGFHRSLTDFEIRIDYVQHSLSSLLCLSRQLRS